MGLGRLLASSSGSLLPLSPGTRRPPFAPACLHPPLPFVSPSFLRLPSPQLAVTTRSNGATTVAPARFRWRVLSAVVLPGGATEETDNASPVSDGLEVGDITEAVESPGGAIQEVHEDSLGIWGQMKEIVAFAGPATGLWVCAPLMSLIDTMVIGQGSSVELAALGPGTVFCDNLCYVFMFLSIATSNMVATSLAKKDRGLVQHQISMLLFVAFICGLGMFFFTKFLSAQVLSAFIGPENMHILPAASTYVQIRGFAWPAVLVGMVAQSASLGMKDSLGPLKALAVASALNGFGDVLLCCVLNYGIAGAAWATMVSQIVAAYMMVGNLNKSGFRASTISLPSPKELLHIFEIAAPVFITMTSKVAFYSLLTFVATSMGTITIAAHQVMINVYCMCTVWGEPLSQTAQSFMPELMHGVSRSLAKARMLLRSLVIIGALTGLILGVAGTSVPWLVPYIFTSDNMVIGEMHKVLLPYFIALSVTPATHSLEGTLMAGRDLKFLSMSMLACLCFGGLLLFSVGKGFGLHGCWWALSAFQWARFSLASQRLSSPDGMLYNEKFHSHDLVKLKSA